MAARQTLIFDILSEDRASKGFLNAGRAASAASDDVMGLARRLDEISKKSATARVGLAGDKEAQAQLDKLDMKLLSTGRRVVDPKVSIEGAAKASAEITALDVQLDHLSAKSAEAGDSAVGLGGDMNKLSGLAMPALAAAAVGLSPVIVTLGLGTAAFGAAAAGAVGPVVKAAQAAGGLRANMAKLDPEQTRLARSVLGLGKQYHAFSASLEPEVLDVFGKGVRIAGHLMHDMQPVAAATGKALGGVLGEIDAEFQGGTWQQFFGFMAKTAGPDMRLLGADFVQLADTLPPLLENLQPVATEMLQVTGTATKLIDVTAHLGGEFDAASGKTDKAGGALGSLAHWSDFATKTLLTGQPVVKAFWGNLSRLAGISSGQAAPGLHQVGASASAAKAPVFNLATAVKGLTTAMQKNVGEVLTLQGDEVTWRQSLQAADKQLRSNSAGLRGNSADALANKQAVLQATQNVMTFADDQLTLGGNLHAASGRIQDQIHWLQVHGGKSKFARDEIRALRLEEDKLKATIRQRLLVTGTGSWHVAHGLGARGTGVTGAAGALVTVGTTPTADDVLARVSKGEAIVPAHLVPPLAPFLKANKVPGFAAGGYAGTVPGLGKWLASEDSSTLRALDKAVAAAVRGALSTGFPGGGSTGPGAAAAQAYARSILGLYGWGQSQFPPLQALWNQESGWRWNALNASSGAYGIPQSLPASKMAAAGPDWRTNPATQIRWGLGYIRGRYGSPAAAEGHELTAGWYDGPGPQFLPRGASVAVNTSGSPERVLSPGESRGIERLLTEIRELLRVAPALQAQGTARALNGLAARVPAPRASSARGR